MDLQPEEGWIQSGLGRSSRSGRPNDWIVDAHGYGKCFVVRADEKLTAFVELQRAIHKFAVSLTL